jgi:hypothetical protein
MIRGRVRAICNPGSPRAGEFDCPTVSYTMAGGMQVALPGRGKRGGARVIYFVHVPGAALYLLDIYAKGEKEDLTNAEKHAIRERIKILKAQV